jgi:rubredoxin
VNQVLAETASCPLCGEARTSIYMDGEDRKITAANVGSSRAALPFGQILRCNACSFVFRRYRPDDESLALLYREADDYVYESEANSRVRTAKRHARIVSSLCPSPGRLPQVRFYRSWLPLAG